MSKTRAPYAAAFRQQMIDLVRDNESPPDIIVLAAGRMVALPFLHTLGQSRCPASRLRWESPLFLTSGRGPRWRIIPHSHIHPEGAVRVRAGSQLRPRHRAS